MTFLVLVATFIGCSCVLVPLLILVALALFDRDGTVRAIPHGHGTDRGG